MHHSWFGPVTCENGSEQGVVRFRFFCGLVNPERLNMFPKVLAAGQDTSGWSISSLALSFRAPQDGCLARSAKIANADGFEIVVGARRFRAAKIAEQVSLPVR